MVEIHYRTCSLCEAMCGIKIEHENGKVLSVKGNPGDILSSGHICPKGVAIQDIHTDPDRLRQPMKREGDTWTSISWDEAFDIVAKQLVAVQKQHGNNAVATYWGNPTVHNFGALLSVGNLRRCLKSRNNFSASSIDILPNELTQYLMYGSTFLFTVPDIDRTEYMLMLGANPAVSNGSLWSAGDIKKRMKALTGRGGKITLIDPRRSETADLATAHYFIKPGTDAVFLLAVLRVIFDKNIGHTGHLTQHLKGWENIDPLTKTFTLDEAAAVTGITAKDIETIATDFSSANSAICYGRIGVSTQAYGGLCQWLIQVINIATGNLDRAGGIMFSKPAFDLPANVQSGSYNRYSSRVRGLPETAGTLPSAALAEEMLVEGGNQIKAFICNAGNPVLSVPNGKQLEKALDGLDFMVAVDFYINETTRKADIILPPLSPLEHGNYDAIFNLLAVRNIAKFSTSMIKPDAHARSEWQIYSDLIKRIKALRGDKTPFKARLWARVKKLIPYLGTEDFVLDMGLRTGPYGKGFLPFKKGLSLARLKREPNGIDLGPLKPALPERLFTKDKMINVAPKAFTDDVLRLKEEFGNARQNKSWPLLLIGRRDIRTSNTWIHNSARMAKGKNRCTLMVHPDDAETYQINEGLQVTVSSHIGSIQLAAQITDEIARGVVSIPFGWGHGRKGIKLSVAAKIPGVSINDITDDQAVDAVSGTAAFNAVPVSIKAAKRAGLTPPRGGVAAHKDAEPALDEPIT